MKKTSMTLAVALLLNSSNAESIKSLSSEEYAKGQDYLR